MDPGTVEIGQDRRRVPSDRARDHESNIGTPRTEHRHRVRERPVSFARLDGADREHERTVDLQVPEPLGALARVGSRRNRRPERDVAQTIGVEARVCEIVERLEGRGEHDGGFARRELQPALVEAGAVSREPLRMMSEREIVDRDHQWCTNGRQRDARRVADVDVEPDP